MATVCKRAAVKAGRTLAVPEMQALIHRLEQCNAPRTCPHGRPTMIQLSTAQLAREFGRA
jgi:DNA mismatch repair protein MutL